MAPGRPKHLTLDKNVEHVEDFFISTNDFFGGESHHKFVAAQSFICDK
jgi:hypothetical protein